MLIVSVILSASIPVITSRTKAQLTNYSKYSSVPIGMIAMWKVDGALPDNTWLECNGQAIPNGSEYEEARRIFGARLPDLRNNSTEYINNLNNYLSKDVKNYLQTSIKPIPKNIIAIWGTNDAIPDGWSEAAEYRGVFLRGHGSLTHTQNNGSTIGNTATIHTSGNIGAVQGDSIRNVFGTFAFEAAAYPYASFQTGPFASYYFNDDDGVFLGLGVTYWPNTISFDLSRSLPVANEIRPVNKAVRYIKYTNASALPDMPRPPQYTQKFRYIVKVRS